ncbi:MAG: helix-turn-helix transcriptional regulator [Alphaproteobacteria bacterium]|nr:helix-turn-helix transcriptional regulator [Alphaproteobacteria bacterium]
MYRIRPEQIKAARALLDWSQGDLAKATGLSITTIRNIESGDMSPRSATAQVIFQIIESVGIEFTEGEGVRKRNDEIRVLQGPNSCEAFYDDLFQTVRKNSGDIAMMIKSQDMLAEFLGFTQMQELADMAHIKCLLSQMPPAAFTIPSIPFRITAKHNISPTPCVIYGDKYALVILDGITAPRFVVFKSTTAAQSYRDHFLALWEGASPVLFPVGEQSRRIKA